VNLITRISLPLLAFVFATTVGTSTASAQIPHFLTPVTYSVPGATMAALADVNGDGFLDIITANGDTTQGSGVSLLLGNGDGTFQTARMLVAGGNPNYVAVGDFNHDGKLDIAIANEPNPNINPPTVPGPAPNSISILLGNGDGTFKPSIDTPTLGALALAAADFNGDGKLDLVVATDQSLPVQILLGNGDGTFTVSNTPLAGWSGPVITGDFNHDGKQDFLAGGFQVLGNGDGTFNIGPATPPVGFSMVMGDFNGDGIQDFAGILINGGGRNPVAYFGGIFLGAADGTFTQGPFTPAITFNNLVAADFNGDGKLDLFGGGSLFPTPGNAITGSAQLLGGLFLGGGDGTFTQASAGFGALGLLSTAFTAVGDLDGNNSPDVVIANGAGVVVALNTFGRPPLLAQVTVNAGFVVGSATNVTGTVSLGGIASAGGAVVTLSSSSPAALLTGGNSVTIPAGSQRASFTIITGHVAASTPVTISATYHNVTQTAKFNIVPAFSLSSVSPVTVLGEFGGNAAVGTVTLTGPASDGVVVTLSSTNTEVLTVPVSIAVAPGATSATFPMIAQHVTADTVVNITGTLAGISRSGVVTVKKQPTIVVVTKAEYVVKKGQLTIEATSTNVEPIGQDIIPSLTVYNPTTGALVGSMRLNGVNKGVGTFTSVLTVSGSLTSVGVQDFAGGLAIASVAQK
jgi:hypothetical protein